MAPLPELLAPAGTPVMLHAAVAAGADAVYLGMGEFNARRNAGNFDRETFAEACDYAHLRGVRVYVAMNTIILPDELESAGALARQCARLGADGFIVQDIGLLGALRRALPSVPIHASTQMSIHSAEGVMALAELGVSRVTLARELSLEEIESLAAVARACDVEVEVFAHGALCVCYSGQCLMSSMIGGRSANRGLCAQACRLPYELIDTRDPERTLKSPGEHLLSPKDLCTIDRVADLASVGVASLKIEGRMKSPEYVHTVVSVYREALDGLVSPDAGDGGASGRMALDGGEHDARTRLASVFSRGFSEAYLAGERGNDLMSYQRPNNRGQFVGRVKRMRDDELVVTTDLALREGDVVEVWTSRSNMAVTVGGGVERRGAAVAIPLDAYRDDARLKHIHANDRVFRVRSADAAFVDDSREPRIAVSGKVRLELGSPLRIEFWPTGIPSVTSVAEGVTVEAARTKPVSRAEVREHVDRLGQTPFMLDELEIRLDEGVGIGFSQLHRVRAAALEGLQERMLEAYEQNTRLRVALAPGEAPGMGDDASPGATHRPSSAPAVCVLVTNPECARAAKRVGADRIYVPALNYRRGQAAWQGCASDGPIQAGYPKHCTLVMPAVAHDGDEDAWQAVQPGDVVVVESLAGLYRGRQVGAVLEVGPSLPITNVASVALAKALGATCVWLSPEFNLSQIAQVIHDAPDVRFGIKVAGAQELMLTEHCALMSLGPCSQECRTCTRRRIPFALRDRKGYIFPVATDATGRTHIYNSVELDNVPSVAALAKAGVSDFMIDATLLSPEETAQATGRLIQALGADEALPKQAGKTTGHLHRGIM